MAKKCNLDTLFGKVIFHCRYLELQPCVKILKFHVTFMLEAYRRHIQLHRLPIGCTLRLPMAVSISRPCQRSLSKLSLGAVSFQRSKVAGQFKIM